MYDRKFYQFAATASLVVGLAFWFFAACFFFGLFSGLIHRFI